ncbi:hypothetical protein AB0424_01425 [Streptomyces sp. NPDC051180]|uniref:hypothetical protein n=1 Tax=unclassified Streptomyces TaxID=2593676 RepID=UPI00344B9C89
MDEAPLTARERQVLAEIEGELDRDEPLAHRLRTMGRGGRLRPLSRTRGRSPGGPPEAGRVPASGVVALLGALTLVLLVLAVVTEATVLIWAFAAVWVLTLTALARLLFRRARRRAGGPGKTG